MRPARALALLLLLVVTSACAVGDDDPAVDDGRPPRALAGTPVPLASLEGTVAPTGGPTPGTRAPQPGVTGSTTSSAVASGVASPGASLPGSGAPSTTPSPAGPPFREITEITDRTGDEEGAGPPWADLLRIEVADNGDNARFTVTMAGALPERVPAGQTYGVGVDLFRTLTQVESDYQLFLDGGSDGWFAYLSSGKTYVRYPGTLGIGGARVVFTVPWSSIGDRASGRFSAFADWAKARTGDNEFSEDHAPGLGTAAYQR